MRATPALLLLGTLTACGPVQSTKAILDADVELEAARAAGAAKTATYEYVAAEAYLHKAREIQGRAEYEPATDFARKAQKLAVEAKGKALASKPSETP